MLYPPIPPFPYAVEMVLPYLSSYIVITHILFLNDVVIENRLMNQSVEGLNGHPKLVWLNLNHNQFASIPSSLLTLSALQYLDLSFNKLTAIPSQLCSVCHLTYNTALI